MSSTIKHEANPGATAVVGTGSTTVRYREQVVNSFKVRTVLAVERIVTGFLFIVGLRRQAVRLEFRHPD